MCPLMTERSTRPMDGVQNTNAATGSRPDPLWHRERRQDTKDSLSPSEASYHTQLVHKTQNPWGQAIPGLAGPPEKPKASMRQATISAAKPGAILPMSSRPRFRAPPSVAILSASCAPIAAGMSHKLTHYTRSNLSDMRTLPCDHQPHPNMTGAEHLR